MLISTQHRFVLLSNRKCASSSLVHSLEPFSSGVFDRDHRTRHTNYSTYQKYIVPYLQHAIGPEVEDYDVFCLYREPTDWLYSWYRFRMRTQVSPEVSPGHWEYAGHVSWHEYMQACFAKNSERFAVKTRQWKFVTGEDDTLKGITLIRYEDITQFLKIISARVDQEIQMVNWNVSPKLDVRPTESDMEFCRKNMVRDYKVYDAIKPLP